ncbi:hypothetical protein FisN_22Lh232 [Fistulifera solaris]|uniref:UBA domain-containing protein n=1 Tax=Fistulifera solaris TaxID=1519565 RepID=A0A1Z5JCQ2_FISSO|nr:hypothetical protein FisN_22Lh232 [Fistulifera solaris]|eukprot:GAX11541.1 hypothetical protein FisN_22Lh232 [Fistulifera solaris]
MQRAATPSSPGWFEGAPASKLMAISSVAALIMYRQTSAQRPLTLYTNKWIFRPGSGESFLGTALFLYWSRGLERQTGSRKFVTVLLSVQLLVITMEHFMQILAMGKYPYMGPYPLLGAYFVWFHMYLPRIHPRFVQILGFTFSEKAIGYLWFAWIAGSEGRNSIVAAVLGMFAWMIYRHFLENRIDFPDAVATFVSPYSSRFLEAPPPVVPMVGMAALRTGGPRPQMVPQRPPPEPPEAAVEQLVGMGFPRAQVIQALQVSNNSIERAADRLLSGS